MHFFSQLNNKVQPLREADKGAGGGAAGNPAGEPPAGEKPDAQDKGGQGGDDKKFSQAELDKAITERLEREKRKREESERKAVADAEAKALAENQKWQELAQKHEGRIKELEASSLELETTKATVEKYKAALEKFYKAASAELPEHIKILLEKLDPIERLEYIAANQDKLKAKGPGLPETPGPANPKELNEAQRKGAQEASNSIYSNLFRA